MTGTAPTLATYECRPCAANLLCQSGHQIAAPATATVSCHLGHRMTATEGHTP